MKSKCFEDIYVTEYQMKILTKLQHDPLPLIALARNNPKHVLRTQQNIKWLSLNGLLDVTSKMSKKRNKTLYLLTDKGREIVNLEMKARQEKLGPLWNKSFLIDSIDFASEKQVVKYITEFLTSYNEGDYLSTTHQKFITDCLRYTDWGIKLIPLISKIKILNDRNLLSIVKTDFSEYITTPNLLFLDETQIHTHNVKNAFRGEIRTDALAPGVVRFHEGKSFNDLLISFLEINGLYLDSVHIHRENYQLVISDQSIRDSWIAFYNANAKVSYLTAGEMNARYAQRSAVQSAILKCQTEFDKFNVGNLGVSTH